MGQITSIGEAEVDAYAKVDRANGSVEYYHIVGETNVPITAEEYFAANPEG